MNRRVRAGGIDAIRVKAGFARKHSGNGRNRRYRHFQVVTARARRKSRVVVCNVPGFQRVLFDGQRAQRNRAARGVRGSSHNAQHNGRAAYLRNRHSKTGLEGGKCEEVLRSLRRGQFVRRFPLAFAQGNGHFQGSVQNFCSLCGGIASGIRVKARDIRYGCGNRSCCRRYSDFQVGVLRSGKRILLRILGRARGERGFLNAQSAQRCRVPRRCRRPRNLQRDALRTRRDFHRRHNKSLRKIGKAKHFSRQVRQSCKRAIGQSYRYLRLTARRNLNGLRGGIDVVRKARFRRNGCDFFRILHRHGHISGLCLVGRVLDRDRFSAVQRLLIDGNAQRFRVHISGAGRTRQRHCNGGYVITLRGNSGKAHSSVRRCGQICDGQKVAPRNIAIHRVIGQRNGK